MNALHLTRRLARRIARDAQASTDPRVRAWLDAVATLPAERRAPKFPHVSVVETFRAYKMAGYEVWRHLDREDPTRKKARLWFGSTRYGSHLNARRAAYKAAAFMSKMSPTELREWWDEYQAARAAKRPVSNLWRSERQEDRIAREDFEQMSHLARKSA